MADDKDDLWFTVDDAFRRMLRDLADPAGQLGRIAAHEAGHALVAWLSHYVIEVASCRINTEFGGRTCFAAVSKDAMFAVAWEKLAIGLAGMAGEVTGCGTVLSAGCRSDLLVAQHEIELAISRRRLGSCPWTLDAKVKSLDVGAMFVNRPEPGVCRILDSGYRHAQSLVDGNSAAFHRVRAALLARRELDKTELLDLLGRIRPWAPIVP